ncbi:MAG: 1,4-dihydroxy-2-naphthoate polyprenyltransferase [Candidatus Omnitrophica bacterium]|nr:1,4-dihydroxy-2-naphthoate polyprenyltransferase [Candidatus Omnitrophota bacterium]
MKTIQPSNPWFLAIRPKTLPAAAAPVLLGGAMAWQAHGFDVLAVAAALAGALFIQIGTNLANDYFDFKKGADTPERVGPVRVTQSGLIAPEAVRNAFILAFALAVAASLYLIVRGGWPIVIIGAASILAGIFYTATRFAFGYFGLGEIFVFIFFGPVAVAGTYYVQTLKYDPLAALAGVAPGLISTAVLSVNNQRDMDSDRKAGKRTLAVRFGTSFAKAEYMFCILGASFVPFIIFFLTGKHLFCLMAMSTALVAIPVMRTVFTKTDGPSLNNALASTGRLLLYDALVFSIGWLL